MTVQEQIEILQAYERGEVIEWKFADGESFKYSIAKKVHGENYSFDFTNCRYRIKPKRWRAEFDGAYYFVGAVGVSSCCETHCDIDNGRYELGNYFRTKEEAEKARKLMKDVLTQFHES